jgi:hypothetical protein
LDALVGRLGTAKKRVSELLVTPTEIKAEGNRTEYSRTVGSYKSITST